MEPLEWLAALLGSGAEGAGAAGAGAAGAGGAGGIGALGGTSATTAAAGAGAGAGDAAAGSLAGDAAKAIGMNSPIQPISSASPVISGTGTPTSPAAPATKSLLDQGADALNGAKNSPLGKIIGAIKPAAAAQPQFSGGFHGPALPQTHAIPVSHSANTFSTLSQAHRAPSLGELLAQSPIGRLSSR